MKNINYLLKKTDITEYTNSEANEIIKIECEVQGKINQLVRCMEEFSELIEVLVEYKIHGCYDRINLIEEIVDSHYCRLVLQHFFDISSVDMNQDYQSYSQTNLIDNCILNLTKSSIKISKCIRNRPKAEYKVIEVVNDIRDVVSNLQEYFDITPDEFNSIMQLKINRSNIRNKKYLDNNTDKDISNEEATTTEILEDLEESITLNEPKKSIAEILCEKRDQAIDTLRNIFTFN